MTTQAIMDDLEVMFDDHPSLDASLRDYDPGNADLSLSPRFGNLYPSAHSGFRSDSDDDRSEASESNGNYSPPAFRRINGCGQRDSGWWRKGEDFLGAREASPDYDSGDDGDAALEAARRTRLPTSRLGTASPEKRRSPSPDPYPTGGGDFRKAMAVKKEAAAAAAAAADDSKALIVPIADNSNNYMRFSMRAEVQHRTEPFEATFTYIKTQYDRMTKSWFSLGTTVSTIFFSIFLFRILFQPASLPPVPDLVKVAGMAKAFEPLIFYSENGVQQIQDLQATGVAVWDLGESVRSTNMTSAPIIVRELDELSDSLKTLSIELTKFFANVDGDVDGILIVMDWAKRELSQLDTATPSSLTSAFDNINSVLCRVGILENAAGAPTVLGKFTADIFGQSNPQRTRQTLQRTFTEFLAVLEESINNELSYSATLFALFHAIDQQFENLRRTVTRENSQQEREEEELLSSLWTKILGHNKNNLRKYEKNRELLATVRSRTLRNKHILVDHNGRLMQLKSSLETLRQKLVSPLVRSQNASTLGVEEQIRGLDGTYEYLRGVRERQKSKMLEMVYGAGARRVGIGRNGDEYAIEGS